MKPNPSISEADFAGVVLECGTSGSSELFVELLREENPVYRERSSSAVVSMRGWVFLAIARKGLSDKELLFVLEELETGVDPYLIAAAAFSLRTYPTRDHLFARYVLNAINNIRFTEEPVDLTSYGGYDTTGSYTTPLYELLSVLEWLGPVARGVAPDLTNLCREPGGFKGKLLERAETVLSVIEHDPAPGSGQPESGADCCDLASLLGKWRSSPAQRSSGRHTNDIVFEDQDGGSFTFEEFFKGRPTIVVFFYTRCDNPLKCSLTITKLARVQRLLSKKGHTDDINIVGITYDGAYDIPQRLKRYGRDRGFQPSERARLFRTTAGFDYLCEYFGLHVNFVESLINRHTVAGYILNSDGDVVHTFDRHLWDENELYEDAVQVLEQQNENGASWNASQGRPASAILRATFGFLAALAFAFFPKCPICWMAYLSLFGIGSIVQIPYSPWLLAVLGFFVTINVAAAWMRGRARGQMLGFYLVSTGALLIVLSRLDSVEDALAIVGTTLTVLGSLLSIGPFSFRGQPLLKQKLTRI